MAVTARIGRLHWACRRGMKELDVLLEAFLAREHAALLAGAWPQLEYFLQEEDDRIWAWILQQGETAAPNEYRELLGALRDAR
jgi:antitoxin CptB